MGYAFPPPDRVQTENDTRMASLKSELAGVCFNQANLLVENGRIEEAIGYYERAAQLGFDSWIFHHYRGNALDRLGRFDEALVSWEKAVMDDYPDKIGTFSDIIMRLVFRGDRALADQWLKKAYEISTIGSIEAEKQGDFRRFLSVDYTSVVGHISLFDYYVKAQKLGWRPSNQKYVLLAPSSQVINKTYLDCWRPYFDIKDNSKEIEDLIPLASRQRDCIGFTVMNSRAHHYWEAWALVQKEWEKQKRKPLLKLEKAHLEMGCKALGKAMGLKDGDWFVCLHVREPGFHGDQKGMYQTTRNADIETYRRAVGEIVKAGGRVIRVGDPSMRSFSADGLYDYATSDLKSDWMDVFLCAACRFFLGTASGLAHLPPVYGVPCALTNWSPAGMRSSYGDDRFITKMIWSREEKRLLTFREMMNSPINHWQYSLFYDQRGLDVIDNDPEEITGLVQEMLSPSREKLSENQQRFESLAIQEPVCYGLSPIGRHFADKYSHLMEVPQ